MKRIYLMLAATSALSLTSVAQSPHTEHNEGRLAAKTVSEGRTRAGDFAQDVKYIEPSNLFTMGYTPNLSYYSHRARRGAAYKAQTWRNVSVDLSTPGISFEWTYDSPDGAGQGSELLKSGEKDLTLSYPFNNGWWSAPVLTEKVGEAELTYSPDIIYRFGGPSAIVFQEGSLDFGMTPYSEMFYRDVNGKMTTTFGSLKYVPTAADPYSVTKWTPVFPEKKDLKMKGFYNIFHAPDAPYAITKIWGWIEYTALKETTLTMTLYKLDASGIPTDEVIARGEKVIAPGSDKSLLFDLENPNASDASSPITIDCAFMAVLEGFAAEGSFSKLQPILGSGTVWEGGDECPWPHNCGVLLEWDDNGKVDTGYFYDSKIYDEGRGSTKKLCACDFLWMVDGDFAWIFEKSGMSEIEMPLAGGDRKLVFNSYYPLDNKYVKIVKDAEWLDFTIDAAQEVASDNMFTVTATPTDTDREGHITITGPAMNYVITVKQTGSSGVGDIDAEKMVVATEYFDIAGRKLTKSPEKGAFIKVEILTDGSRKITKNLR